MTDIRKRLRDLDGVRANDVWDQVLDRTPAAHIPTPASPRSRLAAGLLAAIASVASIGLVVLTFSDDGVGSSSSQPLIRGTGLVIQSRNQEAAFCLGFIKESLPPQCDGVALVAWDWESVDGETVQSGTTWGFYDLTVSPEGDSFRVISVAKASTSPTAPSEGPLVTPCGVDVLVEGDPSRRSREDLERTTRTASREADFAGAWLDESSARVLNLAFTRDIATHRRIAQETWGGHLCVIRYEYTLDELIQIQTRLEAELQDALGFRVLYTEVDETRNRVMAHVVYSTEALQLDIDRRFGAGAVLLTSALLDAHA